MTHRPCLEARPQRSTNLTLAEIVREHADEVGPVSPQQGRALAAIAACRTPALGGHGFECDSCGHSVLTYNSCRNRHCPQCQALAQARWVEARQVDLLPVEYFHVVFTIASELHALFLANQAAAYSRLFRAAAESLSEMAATPRHLGARIGTLAVLHTWTQTLNYHPHAHFIVPGGGPSLDGSQWVSCRRGFLLPVRPLSVLFRGKLLGAIESALASGEMTTPPGAHAHRVLKEAARKKWTVYAKPSFAGPEHVIRYLGRYTHRIALSNERLVALDEGDVTFRYKDRAAGDVPRTMTLEASQFLRRFLLHVLPAGFVRIRYFGGMAHAKRAAWLSNARALLAASGVELPTGQEKSAQPEGWKELLLRLTGVDLSRCPRCATGRLALVECIEPYRPGSPGPIAEAPT
jgi:hypothetical protein